MIRTTTSEKKTEFVKRQPQYILGFTTSCCFLHSTTSFYRKDLSRHLKSQGGRAVPKLGGADKPFSFLLSSTRKTSSGKKVQLKATAANKTHKQNHLTIFTALGVSFMFLFARPVQATSINKLQRDRTMQQQQQPQQTAFVETKSDFAFDRKFLTNEKITELAAADYLESCVDRDFQYTFDWTSIHEAYTLLGSLAFLVVFQTFTAFVDNFIQQQERKEVQEEMERFGRFLSPKTEYRDDVSLDKVDVNMWKAQQRERWFFGRELSAQEDNNRLEDDQKGNEEEDDKEDGGDVDYKNLQRLVK
jgi:hypothetical protein